MLCMTEVFEQLKTKLENYGQEESAEKAFMQEYAKKIEIFQNDLKTLEEKLKETKEANTKLQLQKEKETLYTTMKESLQTLKEKVQNKKVFSDEKLSEESRTAMVEACDACDKDIETTLESLRKELDDLEKEVKKDTAEKGENNDKKEDDNDEKEEKPTWFFGGVEGFFQKATMAVTAFLGFFGALNAVGQTMQKKTTIAQGTTDSGSGKKGRFSRRFG